MCIRDRVNDRHTEFLVAQTLASTPAEAVIDLEQVTYKPGTTILEESQELAYALALAKAGRRVRITEHPLVIADLRHRFGDLFEYRDRG